MEKENQLKCLKQTCIIMITDDENVSISLRPREIIMYILAGDDVKCEKMHYHYSIGNTFVIHRWLLVTVRLADKRDSTDAACVAVTTVRVV